MNIHRPNYSSTRHAFTLMELLIVISIIAILASLARPAYNGVIKKAREVQARSEMSSLVVAIKSYQVEYNKVPSMTNPNPASGGSDGSPFMTDGTPGTGGTIMGCLTAMDTTNNPTNNPRLIQFFSPPPLKGSSGYNTATFAFNDPWGKPYNIVLDDNGDGIIANPYSGQAAFSTDPASVPATSIAYCNGSDKLPFTSDDVRSWR